MGQMAAVDEDGNVIIEFKSFEKTQDGLILEGPNSKAGFLPYDSFHQVLKKTALD